MTVCWPGPSVLDTVPLPAPPKTGAAVYRRRSVAVVFPLFVKVSSDEKRPGRSRTIGTRSADEEVPVPGFGVTATCRVAEFEAVPEAETVSRTVYVPACW